MTYSDAEVAEMESQSIEYESQMHYWEYMHRVHEAGYGDNYQEYEDDWQRTIIYFEYLNEAQ